MEEESSREDYGNVVNSRILCLEDLVTVCNLLVGEHKQGRQANGVSM